MVPPISALVYVRDRGNDDVLALLLLEPGDLVADVCALVVQVLLHRRQHALLVGLGLDERVVVAGPVAQVLMDEFDDLLGDVVQELPVVRHHDRRPRVVLDVLLQPDDRLQVQVVRRLVQQQNVRLDEQRARNGDTHAPASYTSLTHATTTAELPRRHMHALLRELETLQDLLRAVLAVAAVDLVQTVVDLLQSRDDEVDALFLLLRGRAIMAVQRLYLLLQVCVLLASHTPPAPTCSSASRSLSLWMTVSITDVSVPSISCFTCSTIR